ncbi:hypothetical protein PPL_03309 [Heterostelium album PN500]|uniref:Aminotransferase class I/classII domain-containing protein n=1 Tax=Heterostelium pallidum (strain ATCC 26659 / Pp 5 / PN500) TaxID=670386 RepID=D3B4I4_HETP5|nr:hypothetical protein PPL_03309 [Heterostelium album PN500]EFA84232.1 hypothetical protein PPL_03309 [Heterostelium album PN500]|eukprot:XP_020436348.1 hypothetical protein PPL_03309 [Heterostelium album PN500]
MEETIDYKVRNSTLFPHNITVEDCRLAIKDVVGFREVKRENTIVFTYDSLYDESFPNPDEESDPKKSFLLKIRRECRGIIFDQSNGKLLSRKFHKFFNINELRETKAELIDLNQPFILTEKVDGSLIAPILVGGSVLWGSKQGASTDLADKIEDFIARNQEFYSYNQFSLEWLNKDYTPMFEYSSKSQQIILFYGEEKLSLIGIRDNVTGAYISYEEMSKSATGFNVPVIKRIDIANHPELSLIKTTTDLVHAAKRMRNVEGFVLKLENTGHHYKVKTEWYIDLARLHLQSPKEVKNEKDVWSLILSGHIDDTIAMLSDTLETDELSPINQKLIRIKKFSAVLIERIEIVARGLIKLYLTEKQSAYSELDGCQSKKLIAGAFQFYDLIKEDSTLEEHISFVTTAIQKKCKDSTNNSAKLEECRKEIIMVVIEDYTPFLSSRAARRRPSPLRELVKYATNPEIISLGGGLPNPKTFPFKSFKFELKDGTSIDIEGSNLETALQYTPTYGIPSFIKCLKDLQKRIHNLPESNTSGQEWEIEITTGSQEALALAIETLLEEGDSVILESPTYSGTLSILNPLNLHLVGIDIDGNGMKPDELENTLANWDTLHSGKPFPRVLYTIPTGQNPSGCTLSVDRKYKIYEICSKYNLIILEDDPYYFLQFPTGDDANQQVQLPPTFISMDTDRRVLRFDSFSKILSSGLRLGWITGPAKLVERVQYNQQATTLHASGVCQTIAMTLLNTWGFDGFMNHLNTVQRFYKERRDKFVEYANKHLDGLVEFDAPVAGMFIWMKLKGIPDSHPLIYKKAFEKKVIMVPGGEFTPDRSKPNSYVRASFSVASYEQMEEACKRLASLIKENQIEQS